MDMKNVIRYCLSALLVIGVAVSCAEEFDQVTESVQEGVTLTLQASAPATRTMPGVTALNENKITSLYYFFYPMDPNNPTADPLAQQPLHWGYIPDLNAEGEYVLRINFTAYKLNYEVFPRPYNTCKVYIVANLPEDIVIDADTDRSLASLRNIALEADFLTGNTQDLFVMEGLADATIVDRKNIIAATGTIPLDRVASKLTVNVKTIESYQPDGPSGRTWYPEPESMTVEFVNGVSKAVLGGMPVDASEDDYFRTAARGFTDDGAGLWSAEQFYSYPAKWDVGADEEPYVRIMLPWKTIINTGVDGVDPPIEDYQKCYYKLILGGTEMARNTWYDMTVNIGVFGSFDEQEEVLLDVTNTTYYVADWTTGLEINSEILGGRYLVVDKLNYELYNQDVLEIPFTTSHNCEIVDMSFSNVNQATVTYPDYSKDSPNENAEVAWNNTNWSIKIDDNAIKFSHKLRNDLSAGKGNYDYAPYTIKFRIRHSDNDGRNVYYKDITIVQYPAMLIECNPNRKVNNNGGVSVNGGSNYGGVHGLTGSGNKNPNMYVIKTTVLPASSSSVLGDPRSLTANNLSNNNWTSAKGIENLNGANRTLQNYYPTKTDVSSRSIIAPKFRVASSYGVTNSISYTNAQYRCASYQEDGYPAGRWRLPTFAEVEFICKLSADGVIPTLFSNGSEYWCAGGTVEPNTNGTVTPSYDTSGSTYVRCVYDEWYWENTAYPRLPGTTVTFTWGDAAR